MHFLNSKSSTVNSQLRIVLRSHPVSKFIKILRNFDLNIQEILLKFTLRGNLIPNAVRPVEMEKKPEVELALGEYVRLLLLVTWLKPIFAIKEIVSYIKKTIVTAWIIFQKGIQLSSWGAWSNCGVPWGAWSTCERTRLRSCLTGCESSTDDLTQTQACNDQQCPGKNIPLEQSKGILIDNVNTII